MTFYEVIRIETNDIPIKIKSLISIRQGTMNSINVSPNHYFICKESRILYTLSDLLTLCDAFIPGMLAEFNKPFAFYFAK